MSEDLQKKIDLLTIENSKHIENVAQHKHALDGLNSQLEAHREQLNEVLTVGMTLRTNIIHLKKQHQKVVQEHEALKKHFDGVNQQLVDATKKIADLTPKVTEQVVPKK